MVTDTRMVEEFFHLLSVPLPPWGSKGKLGKRKVYSIGCGNVPRSTPSVIGCLSQLRTRPNSPCILAWCSLHRESNEQLLSLNFNSWQTSHCNSRSTYPSRKGRLALDTLLGKQECLIRIPFKAQCNVVYRFPSPTPLLPTHTGGTLFLCAWGIRVCSV